MGFLRDVATAFKPSNLARGLQAARNPPSQAEIEASLQHLTPDQRAAYDANMARVAQARAESDAAWQSARDADDARRVLFGPAGRHVHGATMDEMGSPADLEAALAERGVGGIMADQRARLAPDARAAGRQALGRSTVPHEADPAARERIAREERAARDAARAPYRAADPAPVAISRLATRGETQLDELVSYLRASGLAAHPERVFGVYRVPDRISPTLSVHSEKRRVVEWDVVHAPLPDGPPAGAPLAATAFAAGEQWVARRLGEPSVVDEELALAFCLEAGIGPERCAGLARVCEFRALDGGEEDHNPIHTLVQGVVALTPPGGDGVHERLRRDAPLALGPPPGDVRIDVLNWEVVARAVRPALYEPPPVPSPFPYLPDTPQELLRAYLEVVGLRPEDCYSAQATVHRPRALVDSGLFTKNWGSKQPCADGTPRSRAHGCEHLVVVYRDRPEYVAGRERWAAYQHEVLQARLERGTAIRTAVDPHDDLAGVPTRPLRALVRAVDAVDRFWDWSEEPPPYRYCWPPIDA